ncbi:28S ribosomal protein S29, mitochondrial [Bombina bombina]|uniref:28S ribosomal protein S29, mitochondrial n=1 Tax=Bombina bombina TaxID=8345 RepID=UPI00235B0963|nr:28S ribosomal protein S29, mitochondrial [Bombina bombina]XP_053559167.1 28S ribosomal protein S29, mitochondrial [Bombina bombina]XP_053559176.1 28S ribosomal protein S29, mitochondrial [Bombina bombina]
MLLRQLNRWSAPVQKFIPANLVSTREWGSAVPSSEESPTRDVFRTSENNPENHTDQHEGQHYTISAPEVKTIFPQGLPRRFQMQSKTFNETSLMIRKPGLELIGYLKNTNFSLPPVRYVLYGRKGTGKSITLCHVLHYCHLQDWLLLQIPDAHILVKNSKELMPSSYNKDRYDQPLEASTWLKNFKASNERFLKQIQTQQRYVWSKREITEEGRPLGEVVDQGLTRVKSSSDAMGVVLKELKRQSGGGTFRLLVSVDGVNALWGKTTLKKEDKSPVSPDELTLVHNLKKMLKNDWFGGAIILTVTQTGALFQPLSTYLPHELLGKEGFEALDPFVPILVNNYTEKEFESCYHYYRERKWIQHEKALTEEGKMELLFLSNSNPKEFEKLCAFL